MIKHLTKYWNNIDEWWLSKKTQNNIEEFNKNFNIKTNFFSLLKLKKTITRNNILYESKKVF